MHEELNRTMDALLALHSAPIAQKRNGRSKDFSKPIPSALLNIEAKNRANLFPWRGQFSPQLIEYILDAYCLPNSLVVDPFMGSGTVLHEAAARGLSAVGCEINPAAWNFSKVFEFSNMTYESREVFISELRGKVQKAFPIVIFEDDQLSIEEIRKKASHIAGSTSNEANILCSALIVLLDVLNRKVSNSFVQSKFEGLVSLVRRLPYSPQRITAELRDARKLSLPDQSVDFSVTSPPYINVFNYHQNYRSSVEILGWDLLRVARSEIGSNRANRANRFFTVVQYCIDMASSIQELARVIKANGRAVIVVGYESNVLGTRFYNADIIQQIAVSSGMFEAPLRQRRVFLNRFGKQIREDLLNLSRTSCKLDQDFPRRVGREVAMSAFTSAAQTVPKENRYLLAQAVSRIDEIGGSPFFNSSDCSADSHNNT